MDPRLAGHTLEVLCQHATQQHVTLVASLHTVELALAYFPRIIGVRDGQIAFDLSAKDVTAQRLEALYANEHLGIAKVPFDAPAQWLPRC